MHFTSRDLVAFFLIASSSVSVAQTAQLEPITEDDIKQQVEIELAAYDSMDTDAVVSKGYGIDPGFGFRTQQMRVSESMIPPELFQSAISNFFNSFEYYNASLIELNTRSFGDTGIAWGVHLEEFQLKGQPPESVRVRFSYTFRRDENGELVSVLGHRDAQRYDESGQYIQENYR